jgi:hypothetical protein
MDDGGGGGGDDDDHDNNINPLISCSFLRTQI